MSTSNTFSILFLVNPKKISGDLVTIYVRITVNQRRSTISLKRKIPLKCWDSAKKRARGTSAETKQLNHYLDKVQARLFQCYQDLLLKGKKITAQLIKATYLGEDENSKSLQNLIDYHSRKIEHTLSPGTIKNFKITEGYIFKFLKKEKNTTDVYLRELNYKFLCDFEDFLGSYYPKGHPKAMGHNTIMKHIQRLRKIVTLAYNMEWIDKDPFRLWKNTFEKKDREFLSANELSNLETYEFPVERLDRIRDLFVFSCYTGISYVDIMKLTKDNISIGLDRNKWIISKRQKTNTPIKVPLLEPVMEMIKKYEEHPMIIVSGTLLPKITNEKLNVYLKEVAILCGIKKNLTFHMARHTFATTVTLSNGVPIETVSKQNGTYHLNIAKGLCYKGVGEKEKAIAIIENQIKLNEAEDFVGAYDYLHLGVLYLETGRFEQAIEVFEKQSQNNDLAENQYYSALAFLNLDKPTEYKSSLEKAMKLYKEGKQISDPYSNPMDKIYLEDIENQLKNASKNINDE